MTDFYLKTNHATSLSMNWSWLAPQTAMSKDDDLSDHSRCPAKSPLRWHIPKAAPAQRAQQPRLRRSYSKGCSLDAR
jgi:hypothetical protein